MLKIYKIIDNIYIVIIIIYQNCVKVNMVMCTEISLEYNEIWKYFVSV